MSALQVVASLMPEQLTARARRKYWNFRIELDKLADVGRFLFLSPCVSFSRRAYIVAKHYAISAQVQCPHTPGEILAFVETVLSLPSSMPGCVVEAGCFKGGSTAKFSIAAKLAGRQLVVFDSFQGIPPNGEDHAATAHGSNFAAGDYAGSLAEVKENIRRHGCLETCRFVQGWFDDTLMHFDEPIAAIYLDVDLASSTRTCLKHLYPLLSPGGVLYSQDGHLPLVCDVFEDDAFWRNKVGVTKPQVLGLGQKKLLKIVKPHGQLPGH